MLPAADSPSDRPLGLGLPMSRRTTSETTFYDIRITDAVSMLDEVQAVMQLRLPVALECHEGSPWEKNFYDLFDHFDYYLRPSWYHVPHRVGHNVFVTLEES